MVLRLWFSASYRIQGICFGSTLGVLGVWCFEVSRIGVGFRDADSEFRNFCVLKLRVKAFWYVGWGSSFRDFGLLAPRVETWEKTVQTRRKGT